MADAPARIQYCISSVNVCAWYRCITPGRALSELGHTVRVDVSLTQELVDAADIVVFQRLHEPGVLDAIRYARAAGKLTVYELDDDLWHIHRDSAAYGFYSRQGVLGVIEEAIRSCELVTTTTPALASRLRSLNRATRILPNMLPDEYWQFDEPVAQSDDRIVIGWAGSNTHLPDLKLLNGVMPQLLDRYQNLEFAWAGMSEMPFPEHVRMRMVPGVPLEQYPGLLGQFHIGIAPVVDTVFNESKSDLKYLEYARRGIPVVASRAPSYEQSVVHGVNGFLASNAKDWLKYLIRLIEDVELRRQIGAKGMEFARARMISGNVRLWEEAYGLAKGKTG
ncbi:MAG: glycosyltransferase [Coriobacteriia bacterium]